MLSKNRLLKALAAVMLKSLLVIFFSASGLEVFSDECFSDWLVWLLLHATMLTTKSANTIFFIL